MKSQVIVEKMNGQIEKAVLARPFLPDEHQVFLLTQGKERAVPLLEVCCLQMAADEGMAFPKMQFSSEEILTVNKSSYHVKPLSRGKSAGGFYALLMDETAALRLFFFTNHGVVSRNQKRRLGEILQDEGIVSHYSINTTLDAQRKLREKKLGEIISEQTDVPHRTIENVIEQAYRAGKVTPRMKLGDILINANIITQAQLDEALASQDRGKKVRLGELLTSRGLISDEQLLMVLALKFRLQFVDLNEVKPTPEAIAAIPADTAYALHVLPLEDNGKRLIVATSEPTDYTIPDSLYYYTKRRIEMVVATPQLISAALQRHYPKEEYALDELICGMTEEAQLVEQEQETDYMSELDSHIITLVSRILLDAYGKGASDIHFEPSARENPFQIRYRIDGVCRVAHQIPKTFKRAIISRLKIMANLDISERRKPQSGKILMSHKGRQIEYRLETMPTVGGNEDAVLRILASAEPRPLEQMDFSPDNLEKMKYLMSQPYGLILCVGPTGSGKTTTLHAALKHLNTPELKIWTVEDPVEITQHGLRQVQVHHKIGLTFHEALRSFLRSDPDVIMVGEMRDAETAKTAIEASLTGHLVLSTLHTNSASETVVRLIDIGIDAVNFADCLLGVLAQRLVRRLCTDCKQPYKPGPDEIDKLKNLYGPLWETHLNLDGGLDGLVFMKKGGCDHCDQTGYKGRIAIQELLVNSAKMKRLIRQKAPVDEIVSLGFEEGMKTLIMDGLQKVIAGVTDIDEIMKACRYDHHAY